MFCLVIFLKKKKSIDSLSSLAEPKEHQVKLDVDICKCYTRSTATGFSECINIPFEMDCLLVSQIYHGWTVITAHLEGTKGNSPWSKTLNIIQNIVTITEDGFSYTSSLKPCNPATVYIISPKPILGSHYMMKIFFNLC